MYAMTDVLHLNKPQFLAEVGYVVNTQNVGKKSDWSDRTLFIKCFDAKSMCFEVF